MSRPLDFPAWVQPIASEYRHRRAALLEFARVLPAEAWHLPSPSPGWDCKDLLAHLAGDTGKSLHLVLRLIIAGEPLPDSLFSERDERNARDVVARRSCSVDQLMAEIEEGGDETQSLLAQLQANIGDRRIEGLRGTLAEALRAIAQHDLEHLNQLRVATGSMP